MTIFLPKTSFAMKANLSQKEPEILKKWETLYEKLRQNSKKLPKFILNFGPPYANGSIHIGHAFTHTLKDIFNKSKQMSGFNAPMVPGWDCHGLPIEWKIEEDYRKQGKRKEEVPLLEFRETCRNFAAKWINVQREELKRLGIIADWDNPYSTMSFHTEAAIVEQMSHFLLNNTLYKGLRVVFWSVVEETALADSEVEYKTITSPSLYIGFPINGRPNLYVAVWTTTPWSLPGNRAVSYNPNLEYVIVKTNEKSFIVAKSCVENFTKECEITEYKVEKFDKDEFKNITYNTPFYENKYLRILPGEHVSADAGTGLVHTAPVYGEDDFEMAKKFDIPVDDSINDSGVYLDHVPHFAGDHIFKVTPKVIDLLKNENLIIKELKIEHSYPHSWRSKKPLIYRATTQWFIDIDKTGIRKKALSEISKVNWYPSIGENRIRSMIEGRGDWCISRQRYWGTPLSIFVNKKTGEPLRDEEVQKRIVKIIREYGGDAWYSMPNELFLANKYDPDQYEKVKDVIEVWFDSGCVHAFLLKGNKDLAWPADLYLEGSDQHRGWFQSSLLESVGVYGVSPYKNVLTHGFTLDEHGHKMSKSIGNVIAPQDIIDKYGADLLRQWIIMTDYTEDVRIGETILKAQQEIYRKFRNTIRYLLGAVCDFKNEFVNYDDMPKLEQYMLNKLYQMNSLHQECLAEYDLKRFYNELHVFCTNDLSAFYFDVRKDSLYCDAINSNKRKSVRTVMHYTLHALLRWLAPVLSFTTEEAWSSLNKDNPPHSIHEETFMKIPDEWKNEQISVDFEKLRDIRSKITTELEKLRSEKTIGSSLEATVTVSGEDFDEELMNELAITSRILLDKNSQEKSIVAKKATGTKCERCWKIVEKTKNNMCQRCYKVTNPKSSV